MAFRVGIDLVSVESVRESIAAHGDRYLARVYTPQELEDCRRPAGRAGPDPAHLAARFAAKEAVFKILHVGDQAVAWLDVQTRRDPTGSDKFNLKGGLPILRLKPG